MLSQTLFELSLGQGVLSKNAESGLSSVLAAMLFMQISWKSIAAFILSYYTCLSSLVMIPQILFELSLGQGVLSKNAESGLSSVLAAILFMQISWKSITAFILSCYTGLSSLVMISQILFELSLGQRRTPHASRPTPHASRERPPNIICPPPGGGGGGINWPTAIKGTRDF